MSRRAKEPGPGPKPSSNSNGSGKRSAQNDNFNQSKKVKAQTFTTTASSKQQAASEDSGSAKNQIADILFVGCAASLPPSWKHSSTIAKTHVMTKWRRKARVNLSDSIAIHVMGNL
uniref:Uncharacterized protein n=1 Tax=Ditylenchus dipsaci TaxID=166011 RepID=A0A915D2L5_9BILA